MSVRDSSNAFYGVLDFTKAPVLVINFNNVIKLKGIKIYKPGIQINPKNTVIQSETDLPLNASGSISFFAKTDSDWVLVEEVKASVLHKGARILMNERILTSKLMVKGMSCKLSCVFIFDTPTDDEPIQKEPSVSEHMESLNDQILNQKYPTLKLIKQSGVGEENNSRQRGEQAEPVLASEDVLKDLRVVVNQLKNEKSEEGQYTEALQNLIKRLKRRLDGLNQNNVS